MKRLRNLLPVIFILISLSCHETAKKPVIVPKKQPEKISVIKRTVSLKPLADIKELLKNNKEFIKLYESLKPDSYSIDELIDLTDNDIKLLKKIKIKHFSKKIDTPPVQSRLVLTEVNFKRLDFLIHKKHKEPDTIRKTLDEITRNINTVIEKIELYNQSIDEFENILVKDSLMQVKKDSMLKEEKRRDILNRVKSEKMKKDFKIRMPQEKNRQKRE